MNQPTRASQKSETRARVLQAATLLCGRHGFVRTTTAAVAREAGLSHGALFTHFPTRAALFEEVAGGMGRNITTEFQAHLRPKAGLRRCLEAHVASIAEHEELYRHFLVEWTLLEFDARTVWAAMHTAVAGHFADAVAQEDVRKGMRLLLFDTWMGLLHQTLMQRAMTAEAGPVLAVRCGELVEYFTGLVRKGKKK